MATMTRADCARELLNSLQIPSYELADMLGIRGARVSDFKTGKPQPAALETKIADAVYHVGRIWDRVGYRVPLHEIAVATANLEYTAALENELNRRQAVAV
jgi:hypothetical protein